MTRQRGAGRLLTGVGVVVAALALVALALGLNLIARQPGHTPRPLSTHDAVLAAPGLGDEYFPTYGNAGYDVQHYDIDVNYDPATSTLSGTTTFTAVATEAMDGFHVDLLLTVSHAWVNDQPVAVEQTPNDRDVALRGVSIGDGETFTVTVSYSGRPLEVSENGRSSWLSQGGEQLIANEPQAAPWWFASNDHPSDPATYTIRARVPSSMQAISAGALESRDAADERDHDTWVWQVRQPCVTYAVFLGLGDYEIRERTIDGRQQVDAISKQHPSASRERMFTELAKTGDAITALERLFGPYPLDALGGFVPVMQVWYGALETQARPVYHPRAVVWRVIVHEYAHMWVGNKVTLADWSDIFNNEAFASYSEWLVDEASMPGAADKAFKAVFAAFGHETEYWQVRPSDPGPFEIFSVAYTRGPMTLHALRVVIGDEAFTRLLRDWAAQQGPRSVDDFREFATQYTDIDLTAFFAAWLDATVAPEQTPANGFR